MYRILLVEDDPGIAQAVCAHLRQWELDARCVQNFRAVMEEFTAFDPQLVLLDISLPFFNGYHWCTQIRAVSRVPVVFLSSASENMNIVMAMNMGADDFIAKPFDLDVLTAKVQALLRRTYDFAPAEPVLSHRGAVLQTGGQSLLVNGEKLPLSKNEYRILWTLLKEKGKIVSRERLMEALWQTDSFVDYNASAMAKGSVFKAITARTLLEYDGDLPEDYSLYNDSFEDLSAITLNSGKTIQNWDYNIAGDYGSDLGNGQYSRLVSLSDALQFSSNTYFVRHALQLPDCYDKLRSLFGLDKSLTTEINSLDGIETADERQPYLYFGQDAYLSSIRLCQLYNYAFSGEFYVPFYIASVIQPDGEKIYTADPQPKEAYHMDITPEDDILAGGLADCFDAYTNGKYTALSGSGRILCKSGTAELDDKNGRENRTMMMTILSEDRTQVLASCCMIVCSAPKDSVYNNVMIEKLLQVASAAGIL